MADESKAPVEERKKEKEVLPPWIMPNLYSEGEDFWKAHYPLRIMNSLTRRKDPFVPISGKRVLWYMCGPTVYDLSHLGHARTYLSFDILRRIMEDYFGYDVVLVMNITDIDDKIIDRATERNISFNDLARKYEKEYMDDMASLGIKAPDCMTRVSEYIPEVIEYVQTIIDRGYAYAANGSVYFDTVAFGNAKNHVYGKLVPSNVGNTGLLAEGEGHAAHTSDKRNSCDFALWKKSKPGEPKWDSPWGEGRPGWHIECSAMSGSSLKEFASGTIDIHSGGWDLRFPHHENEIAQSEAYFDFRQWVNYFVHSGHLDIAGRKMSKSLKNFITIREALEEFTARQMRVFYLMHRYNSRMDYSPEGMAHAADLDRQYNEFFLNMKALLRATPLTNSQRWDAKEIALMGKLTAARQAVREALCDDFDTPRAMNTLQDLMKATNVYVREGGPVRLIIQSVSNYVTKMFNVFGLINPLPNIGYPVDAAGAGADLEETVAPYITAFAKFREQVRSAARSGDVSSLLSMCDDLRDTVLPELGVRLEDKDGAPTTWKLVNKQELAREREAKEAAAAAAAAVKAAAKKKLADAEAKSAVDPRLMFQDEKDEHGAVYSQFDDNGVPTHDSTGAEIANKRRKKLLKRWTLQSRKYEKFLAKQN